MGMSTQSPPHRSLARRLQCVIEAGRGLSLEDFSETELIEHTDEWANSQMFGDVAELLLCNWEDLDDSAGATKVICLGLRSNPYRDALIHAADAVADAGLTQPRSFALALDARAADENTPPPIRIEAVAGLTRLALQSPQFKSVAATGLLRLIDSDDVWVKAKLCRLAAIHVELLGSEEALAHLMTLRQDADSSAEANEELGFLAMTEAFQSEDAQVMSEHLRRSVACFKECESIVEDGARVRLYADLARALSGVVSNPDADLNLNLDQLKEDARSVAMYRIPRAGSAWLLAPPEAELEWIPLLEHLSASGSPRRADPYILFADFVQLFGKVRAVQVVEKGRLVYRPPVGLSAFAERTRAVGLARRLIQDGPKLGLSSSAISTLFTQVGPPGSSPGKS